MTIEWHTKNINIQNYYKIIRRTIILNSDYKTWQKIKNEWRIKVIPTDRLDEFRHFFNHLNVEVSEGIAWGITGQKEMYLFVNDSRNPFIIRSNTMPISHEILHAVYQENVGTFHITRQYTSPEGRKGTSGAAATVIVHDNWYGSKDTIKIWIRWGFIWLPITIPFIPIKKAKEIYNIE